MPKIVFARLQGAGAAGPGRQPARGSAPHLDALNKGFDTASDPIVRVEAARIRKNLERYYAEAGTASGVCGFRPARLVNRTRGREAFTDALAALGE